MPSKPLLRLAAAAVGGLAVAGLLLAVLFILNAGRGFAGSTVATPLGWTIPLIAGVLVAGLSWLLLADRGRFDDPVPDPPATVTCVECGQPCLSTWRLCPYCGTMLGARERVQETRGVADRT